MDADLLSRSDPDGREPADRSDAFLGHTGPPQKTLHRRVDIDSDGTSVAQEDEKSWDPTANVERRSRSSDGD